MPKKVQLLLQSSSPIVRRLCPKTPKEAFVGGRPGIDRELLFVLLLIKKTTNWSFRTVAEMGNVSHSTLVRTNDFFLKRNIYEKVFSQMVRAADKKRT